MSKRGTATQLRATEAQWQKTVMDAAKTLGWTCYHTTFSIGSRSGFPDLALFHPEHGTVYAELKTQTGNLTDNQVYWLGVISAAGERVYVWRPDDWDEVDAVLQGEPGLSHRSRFGMLESGSSDLETGN